MAQYRDTKRGSLHKASLRSMELILMKRFVRQESLRYLIALSVQLGLTLEQVDVTTVFLNGTLNEVNMRQPEGFVAKGKEELVCKLKKSIYRLKQSPRC